MNSPLFTFMEQFYPLTDEIKEAISNRMRLRRFAKFEMLIEYGHPNKDLFFLQKGFVRCYYFKNGKEITDWFLGENQLVALGESYYKKISSRHGIQALEDCETLTLTYDDMEELYDKYPLLERNSRYTTMEYSFYLLDRYRQTKNMPVEQRYKELLSVYPDLLNRVQLNYIASYLGTTISHLSRIRSKLSH